MGGLCYKVELCCSGSRSPNEKCKGVLSLIILLYQKHLISTWMATQNAIRYLPRKQLDCELAMKMQSDILPIPANLISCSAAMTNGFCL